MCASEFRKGERAPASVLDFHIPHLGSTGSASVASEKACVFASLESLQGKLGMFAGHAEATPVTPEAHATLSMHAIPVGLS